MSRIMRYFILPVIIFFNFLGGIAFSESFDIQFSPKKPALKLTAKILNDSTIRLIGTKQFTIANIDPLISKGIIIDPHLNDFGFDFIVPGLKSLKKNNLPYSLRVEKTGQLFSGYTFIIDPGHGGKDPGAIGPKGIREKDITFALAVRLARFLNKKTHIRAVLTRFDDRFISLSQRRNLSKMIGADYFISIHSDGYMKSSARGASVYAVSEKGATSAAAKWLAHEENTVFDEEVRLAEKTKPIKNILFDLTQRSNIKKSLQMGQFIIKKLGKNVILHSSRVEQAAFVVLKSPQIPAILIESGFVSNPQEVANLIKPGYQKKLVQNIASGIDDVLAFRLKNDWYTVQTGDTLFGIAASEGSSVDKLKVINSMNDNRIYPNQRIRIH